MKVSGWTPSNRFPLIVTPLTSRRAALRGKGSKLRWFLLDQTASQMQTVYGRSIHENRKVYAFDSEIFPVYRSFSWTLCIDQGVCTVKCDGAFQEKKVQNTGSRPACTAIIIRLTPKFHTQRALESIKEIRILYCRGESVNPKTPASQLDLYGSV